MKVKLTVRRTETREIITDIDDLKEGEDLLSMQVWRNAEAKVNELPTDAGEQTATITEVTRIAQLERRADD